MFVESLQSLYDVFAANKPIFLWMLHGGPVMGALRSPHKTPFSGKLALMMLIMDGWFKCGHTFFSVIITFVDRDDRLTTDSSRRGVQSSV